MDFRHPYLTRQLIAYIGNKRALLPFLEPVFSELAGRAPVRRFVDPFAGSGAVSRLGKLMGYEVHAADLEHYAWVLNAATLETQAREAYGDTAHVDSANGDSSNGGAPARLFREDGGIDAAFARFHRIGARAAESGSDVSPPRGAGSVGSGGYIARHYAPARTDTADYRRERVFYTAENARYLDAVREAIELEYPGWDLAPERRREKFLLLAALLYEASRHANTSGVFKAYHKGFGGHGGDALGRIMSPMQLEVPPLVDGPDCTVAEEDATGFLTRTPADIVYLDPPYNSHQYGSNYFMLNTIARWDRPPVADERRADGSLTVKAGIRPDWRRTRSDFCSRSRAPEAFRRLLDAVDARFIVLSYSSDGIVPLEHIMDLLSGRGRVELFATDYTSYRGGRQSIRRATAHVEFALAVTTGVEPDGAARGNLSRFLLRREVAALLRDSYVPERVRSVCDVAAADAGIVVAPGRVLSMVHLHRFAETDAALADLPAESLRRLREGLESARCATRQEEARVLIELLRDGDLSAPERRDYRTRLLRALRKYAYGKYEREFEETARAVEAACLSNPDAFDGVDVGVRELRELARKRRLG